MNTVTRARAALVVAVVLAIVGGTVAPADASKHKSPAANRRRQAEIEREIKTLRSEVAEASAEEAELLDRIDAARTRRAALDAEVAALEAQIRAAEVELAAAQEDLDVLERELRVSEAKLRATEAELEAANDELRERAVAAYVGQPKVEVLTLALGVRTIRELTAVRVYYRSVVGDRQEEVDRYRALRDEIDDQRERLAVSTAAAYSQRDAVAEKRAGLETARRGRDRVREQIVEQEAAQQELLREVERRISEFESQIRSLRRESDAITALLRKVQAGQGAVGSGRGVLARPIPGARLTSPFGNRVHPIFRTTRMHTGIDLAAASGTPIRAPANGVVVAAGSRGGLGLATIIDHGGSLATLYAHQSALLVQAGQRVTKGQIIGRVGSTGFSTGPHLHFEVRVGGAPVDPLRYL